ncbi:MAG: serine/threonine-protein kinase [Planctomycetota bacterium]
MSLLLKVACPKCNSHQDSLIGSELRCESCGYDYRAYGHGDCSTRIISVTPDELDHLPYSQRETYVPRTSTSAVLSSDPSLLDDLLLRDLPMKDNARWAGRVRLIKKVGQGGMGGVYRGFDESLSLDVAVKILPIPPNAKELHFAERFRQEARISAQINSPHVVRMRDVGENGIVIYLVMDYIDGRTARQVLDTAGIMPVPQALQIVHDATLGMQAAHERSIVHRDIKPENILVSNDGRVLLSDLGLAKLSTTNGTDMGPSLTRKGLLLGTPEYMSPEQWEIGSHISARSDIWSMGVTLWVLLTRHTPFEDNDILQLAKKIKESPLPDIHAIRPDVPEKVAAILYHCMAKNPQRRYMNSAALASALSNAMMHPDQQDDDFALTPLTQSSLNVTKPNYTEVIVKPTVLIPSNPVISTIAAKSSAAVAKTPVAPVAPAKPSSKTPKVIPISNVASGRIEAIRPVPIPLSSVPRPGPAPKPDLIIRKKKSTTTRKVVWLSGAAAAACAAFALYHYSGFSFSYGKGSEIAQPSNTPAIIKSAASDITIDVTAPQRVKVGETAVLTAAIKNADDPSKYDIVWRSGKDKPQTGTDIPAVFENDKEFDVIARRVDTGKEVVTKRVRVEVDLAAMVREDRGPDGNAPATLQGIVTGGAGSANTEVRWFESKRPNEILSTKLVFVPEAGQAKPGNYVYVFQARRRGARVWETAATDKYAYVIKQTVPAEYTQAIKNAEKFMKEAESAETGTAAQLALKDAIECYESAQRIQPDSPDVLHRKSIALKRAKAEDDYARLMSESRDLYYQAEGISTDLYDKSHRLELALRPLRDAKTLLEASDLRVHPEAISEINRIQDMMRICSTSIDSEKNALKTFDLDMNKARGFVREAEKYQNLAVALPHWEDAYDTFTALKKRHPKLASNEGFQLESKKAQENFYKAYLFVTLGFVPAKPEDPLYQNMKKAKPLPTSRNQGQSQVSTQKERGALVEQ